MIEPQKLVFIIVNRGECKRLVKLLNKNGFTFHTAMLAHGTAPSEVLACFGLAETEKTVLTCFTGESRAPELFDVLNEQMGFKNPNTGIAFSIRVSGLAGMSVLNYIAEHE